MADRVKGITVVLGGDTTGLNKALAGTNKEIKNTQSQLKDVERLLKLDPTNTQLLEQRQRLLADAVSETKTKLDTLKEAEKQVQAQFERGEISRQQYDALQREIADTEISLKNLTKRANDADGAIGGIDEKPLRDVEKAAENADEALEDAGKEASALGDYLKAGAIIEGAKGLADAMGGIVDDAKEYQQIMGTLKTSSEAAGYSTQETEQSFKQLQGVLGDSQASATTLANLQAIGLSQKDLTAMIENSIGAWAKYGDSIPIDGLAESINETIKAGQVTGTFADVLNWGSKEGETFGVKLKANTKTNEEWNKAVSEAKTAEDFFNLALQDAGTEAERADLIMQAMADQGLSKSSEAWRENNEELVANNEANDEYQSSMAELSQTVMPILTEITKATTEIVNFILSHQEAIVAALLAIGAALLAWNVVSIIQDVIGVMKGLDATTKLVTASQAALNAVMNANPIAIIITVIAALVAAFIYLWNNCEEFREFWINLWDIISQAFSDAWDAIVEFFTKTLPDVWNSVVEWFNEIPEWWNNLWTQIGQFFMDIWDSIVSFFTETIPSWIASIGEWFAQLPYKIGYALGQAVGSVVKFGQDVWNWITTELPKIIAEVINWFAQLPGKIWDWLLNTLDKVKQWGTDTYNSITKAASDMINGVINWFSQLPGRIWNWLLDTVSRVSSWGNDLFNTAVDAAKNTVNNIIEWFSDLPSEIFNIGKNIVEGIWNGITSMTSWLWDKVTGFGQGIVDGFKNALGIHSPSRVMRDQIGKMLPPGIVLGVEDEIPQAIHQIEPMINNLASTLSQFMIPPNATPSPELLTVSTGSTHVQPLAGSTTNTTNLGGVSITVYGAPGQNVNELANIIMDKIEFATTRKGAVFGA